MADTKYGKYISKEPVRMPAPRSRAAHPMVSGREETWPEISDMNCNFAFLCVSEPSMMPDPPHKHDFDEYLFFVGGNLLNMADFGAEIEIALGEEWERHLITTTSIVYIPKGLQHCPINVKKVDKPFLFGHIMLSAKYSSDRNDDGPGAKTVKDITSSPS
jgi:hypothetical protein